MLRRRKPKRESDINMERWLISYADFITLLFIVFLILYASSTINSQKFGQLVESFKTAGGAGTSLIFDHPGSNAADVPAHESVGKDANQNVDSKHQTKIQLDKANEEAAKFTSIQKAIEKYAQENGVEKDFTVVKEATGLHLSITGAILFENGKADLLPEAKRRIKDIFNIISTFSIDNPIRIEGHTDNRPIHTAQFPSNWELSSARAVNLLRFLIEEYKLSPARLSAAAYGEYHPIASNQTAEGRTKNRRVEIYILKNN